LYSIFTNRKREKRNCHRKKDKSLLFEEEAAVM